MKTRGIVNSCIHGDAYTTLDGIVAAGLKVQMCVTSPPYFGLRDYGAKDQIGLEQRVPLYIDKLVSVFAKVFSVLADDGVLIVNIGDTYAGYKDGKFPPQSQSNGNQRDMPEQGAPHRNKRLLQQDGYKDKELMGIPWRFAFAMRDAGWLLRQEIIWSKPNYTPEKVRDRCVRSHEKVFIFTKQPKYYFNGDLIRVPSAQGDKLRPDVWVIPTNSSRGSHFAMFPPELIEPFIIAGSKRGDIVLDPFMGSGTTAGVAVKHNRNWIGIEVNSKYIEQMPKRILSISKTHMYEDDEL